MTKTMFGRLCSATRLGFSAFLGGRVTWPSAATAGTSRAASDSASPARREGGRIGRSLYQPALRASLTRRYDFGPMNESRIATLGARAIETEFQRFSRYSTPTMRYASQNSERMSSETWLKK